MELTTLLFTIFTGISLFIYYFIHRRLNYWKVRNVPHIEPEFFHGNARGVGKTISPGKFFKDMYFKLKNKGPVVGVYMYVEPMAIIMDLDLVKTILVKEFNTFPNRGLYHNEKDDPTSANLASIEDEQWKILRNKISPTFSSGKIKNMFPIVGEVADKMIERIEIDSKEKGSIEVKDILARFTTDVIGRVGFGIECNSLDDNTTKFYQIGLKAFSNINFFTRTLTSSYPDLARKLHIKTSDPEVAGFYKDIVEQTIKYRIDNNIQSNDFMSLLMKMMKDNSLTFNEVWSQSVVFFLAGYETSSTALNYCLYEMSQRKDICDKARESVKKALEKHNGELNYDAVNDMQYIEQCVNEALRKHPPANATRRIPREDFQVPNSKIVIEKGVHVIIPVWGIHFDPEIYPEPETYNPDRFTPEEVAKRHNMSFLPFGEGPRVCIGERFAMVEIKLALAKILMNFEFELDYSKTPVPMPYETKRLILTAAKGVFIKFRKI
ncbi:hypothetical protein PVAND_004591 [Polypedilum vanderplanki]|uniref:Cytochrome P450 n=1 Tax=Polypedilum vanderplanki TaxID=319348 RepID=A0A9J6BYK4_POLVA|nr:hypothetical protein PVAND_004591 [Polypedilum vanderplanki]